MDGLDTSRLDELKTRVKSKLEATEMYRFKGTVSKLLGLTVEVKLPGLKVGDLCYIETKDGRRKPAEVQAFKGEVAQLLLLYDGEGIGQGSLVTSTGKPITRKLLLLIACIIAPRVGFFFSIEVITGIANSQKINPIETL